MILTEKNFILFSARYYDNPNAGDIDEFKEDLLRFKYLRKLFFNYKKKGNLKERLILNHFVVLYNVFEHRACTKMIILKLEDYLGEVFPFLMLLGYLPPTITGIYDEKYMLQTKDVILDSKVIDRLRCILREGQTLPRV